LERLRLAYLLSLRNFNHQSTNPSPSSADNYKVRYSEPELTKALVTARRHLKTEGPVAKVATALSRYMDCTDVTGLGGRPHEDLRSQIFAVMADAYRLEGNLPLALKWYRRASSISSSGFAPIYARLVCENQASEFYEDALKTLEEHLARWFEKPLKQRFFLRLRMWFSRQQRELARNEDRDLEFLRQHAVAKAA